MARDVVCISHASGAGGEEVGRLVADQLGYLYVDDDIVARAAAAGAIDPAEVADEERRKSFARRLLEGLAQGGEAWAVTHGGSSATAEAQRSDDVRALIKEVDPEIVEEWKWRGTPVWEHDGMVCTGETYKKVVKLTFAKGASLDDPAGLFNSSLDGNVRRAIDIQEDDELDEPALKDLVRAAIALNESKRRR